MKMREDVIVKTGTGELQGYLFVGHDGLPGLEMAERRYLALHTDIYRPATFPAAWELRYVLHDKEPILYPAWCAIQRLQEQIAQAEREADDEERDTAREGAIEARIEEEVDHASSQ